MRIPIRRRATPQGRSQRDILNSHSESFKAKELVQNKKIIHRIKQVKHVRRENWKSGGLFVVGFVVFAFSAYATALVRAPWVGLVGMLAFLVLFLCGMSRARFVPSESEALVHIDEALEHLSDSEAMDYESAAAEIRTASTSMRATSSAMSGEVRDAVVTLKGLLKTKLLLLVDKHDHKKAVPILRELETQLLNPSVVGFKQISKKLDELPGETQPSVSSRLSSKFTNRGAQVVFSIVAGVVIPLVVGYVYSLAAQSDPALFIRQNITIEVPGSFGLIAVFLGFFRLGK